MKNRYKNMEKIMLIILFTLSKIFIAFLIASGTGVLWLKVICAIVTILLCPLCLVYLYLTGELLSKRSLWITTAFAALLICTVFSLILGFPCPRP